MKTQILILSLLFAFACGNKQNISEGSKNLSEEKEIPIEEDEELLDEVAMEKKVFSETAPFKDAEYAYIYAHPVQFLIGEDSNTNPKRFGEFTDIIETEKVKLDKQQLAKVFENIYGYPCDTEITEADCFDPRHTIIFHDKNREEFSKIQICFECGNMRADDGYPYFCTPRHKRALENYFKEVGVQYIGERGNEYFKRKRGRTD